MEETFEYDNLDRLTEVWSGSVRTGLMVYDGYGRMKSKTTDGGAVFTAANNSFNMADRPHALKSAAVPTGLFPSTTQTVSYTGFDKTLKVKQGNDSLVYTYGHDQQRIAMEERVGGAHRTKRYVGGCEYVTETEGGNTLTRSLTYLTGPFGVFAVVEKCNGEEILHYILKDNLGSWTTITDSDGNVEQRLSYDAWGSLRNSGTWSGSFTGKPMFDRGFTGHEHLTAFGLINMKFTLSERSAKLCLSTAERCELGGANGRMYDPVMSSFLSVDRFLQNPSTSQGFNRYAYCMYNPLRYVDPTGFYITPGDSHHPDNPPCEIIDGQVVFLLPEVTITPYDEPTVTVNESYYPNTTSGGGPLFDWSTLINNDANGSTIGQGGGGNMVIVSTPTTQTTNIQPIANYYNTTNKYLLKINEVNCVINSGNTIIGKGAEWAKLVNEASKEAEAAALFSKLSKISKNVGIAGIGINLCCIGVQITQESMPWKEGLLRGTMAGIECVLNIVPCVGPILSISLTAFDLGGGFDNNLYNTEKWWK